MSHSVLAVVVSYNPHIERLDTLFQQLKAQVAHTVVIDNASNNQSDVVNVVTKAGASDSSLTLLKQLSNNGLGAAHNLGIDVALKGKYSHVLLLDQDSMPSEGMVSKLLAASKNLPANEKLSAVGPTYQQDSIEQKAPFIQFGKLKFKRLYCDQDCDQENGCGKSLIKTDFLISSGCLISTSAIKEIGLMDETLFIDHVDTEWFLRARSKGYVAYGVCDAIMTHKLGEQSHRVKLKRERNVPQHKPFRYYYIFRNSILLYKRRYCSLQWKWNDCQRLLMIFIMYAVFQPPRKQNFYMMCKGIWHGLQGKAGKLTV